jgi:hypothetical protein
MHPQDENAQYLETVRDVYAEAAVTPQPKLCCTTAPIWRLPGLRHRGGPGPRGAEHKARRHTPLDFLRREPYLTSRLLNRWVTYR